jgi:two-component system cell cycle response regulator
MGAKILLVEDNPTNLQLMEYLLRAFGHATVTAADGAEGVAAAVRESPDVILMDLQMPKLNGYDAARQIKAVPTLRTVPIVAVTAFAMVGDRDRILAQGFDGYIAKPIVPETFVDQVQAFIPATLRSQQPAVSPETPSVASPAFTGRTILVVDNSPVNVALVKSTLQPFGYEVLAAGSVQEALQIAEQQMPDLILSDVHMPGQSGYDFFRIVKADGRLRAVPFVFISSTVWGEQEREAGLGLGAHRFILRPIEPEVLIAEIAACLSDTTKAESFDGHDSCRRR